jgi:hypothetical protein
MTDDETRPLLHVVHDRRREDEEASSPIHSRVTEEEHKLYNASVGERLA